MKRLVAGTWGLMGALLVAGQGYGDASPVGRLPGGLSVSPGGSAGYNIPIKVPEGIKGLSPRLSLNYSSSPGRGLAGVGWTLSGLSSIDRCGKQKALDGSYDTDITLSASDKLCLDGTRLFEWRGVS